jgi:hypothetical protein
MQPQKGRDENLLKHIFSLPADAAAAGIAAPKRGAAAAGRGAEIMDDGEIIESRSDNYLQLTPIKGGFNLAKKAKSKRVPRYITVWLAYEVRTGNPFKKYTPLDFDVGQPPISIRVTGAGLLLNKHNVIQIEVRQGNFKLTVTGFDTNRDLRVKTNP